MASTALLKVRFPDGTIRYGCYGATADVPYDALVDDIDEWDEIPRRPETPPPPGWPVEVEIACNYGGGFYWTGTAFPDRLIDNGMIDTGGPYGDVYLKPTTDGYPDWYNEDSEEQ